MPESAATSAAAAAAAAAAAPYSSAPPAHLDTDARALNPGDQRVVIDPLASDGQRAKIPRADGYDPDNPNQPRYGPSWKSEEDRRMAVLQADPTYSFLVLMAGYADVNLLQLVSTDSLSQRAAAADIRKRITELKQKSSLQDLEGITEQLERAQREYDELITGLEEVSFVKNSLARKQALERQRDSGITSLSSMQGLMRRYERLQAIFVDWAVRVYFPPQAIADLSLRRQRQEALHQEWLSYRVPLLTEADQFLLKDFVSGVEFGNATLYVLGGLRNLYDDFNKYQSVSSAGAINLPREVHAQWGKQLVDLLREYAAKSYDNPAHFDTVEHRLSAQNLPRFRFNEGLMLALERPALIQQQIRQVNEEISTRKARDYSDQELQRLQKELAALSKEQEEIQLGITIDATTWSRVRHVIELLEAHALQSLSSYDFSQWLAAFGDQVALNGNSEMLARRIATLRESQAEIERRNTAIEKQIDELEERNGKLRVLRRRIDTMRADIERRRAAARDAQHELETMDTRFYQQTYDYASRPENSGVMLLNPVAAAALDHAYELARNEMRRPDITLDELMTSKQYWRQFAHLAGLCRKLAGMTNGRSFAQSQQIYRSDEAIETLLRESFSPGPMFSYMTTTTPPPVWQVVTDVRRMFGAPAVQGFNPVSLVNRDGSSARPDVRDRLWF
jgi:hypothetical protein